jgi:hypothetical protein
VARAVEAPSLVERCAPGAIGIKAALCFEPVDTVLEGFGRLIHFGRPPNFRRSLWRLLP